MRSSRLSLALATILCMVTSLRAAEPLLNHLTEDETRRGYKLLFDGKSLSGWTGAPGLWRVEDGAIVGSTDGHAITQNSFLIFDRPRPYRNFVLRLQLKLRNGNTGIQFRSTPFPGWVVKGYQADASDVGERSAWGNFYEEKGRGRNVMATPTEGWERAKGIVRTGEWNEYEIYANGDQIRLTLNGTVTIDTRDAEASEGVIAVQMHTGEPMEVRVRTIRIKELP